MAKGFELGFAQDYGPTRRSSGYGARMTEKEKRDQKHYEDMGAYEELTPEEEQAAQDLVDSGEAKNLNRAKRNIAKAAGKPLAGSATKRARAETRETRSDAKIKAMKAKQEKTLAQTKGATFKAQQDTTLFDTPKPTPKAERDLGMHSMSMTLPKPPPPPAEQRKLNAIQRAVRNNILQGEATTGKTEADTALVNEQVKTHAKVVESEIDYKKATSENSKELNKIRTGELNEEIRSAKSGEALIKAHTEAEAQYRDTVTDIYSNAMSQKGDKDANFEDILSDALNEIAAVPLPAGYNSGGDGRMGSMRVTLAERLNAELVTHRDEERYHIRNKRKVRMGAMNELLKTSLEFSPESKAIYDAKSPNSKLEAKYMLYLQHRIGKHSNVSMGQILKDPVLQAKVLVHEPNRDNPFWTSPDGTPLQFERTVTNPITKEVTSSKHFQPRVEFDLEASLTGLAEYEKELIAMGKLPSGDQAAAVSKYEIPKGATAEERALAMAEGQTLTDPRPVKTSEVTSRTDPDVPWDRTTDSWEARRAWNAAEGITDIIGLTDMELDNYWNFREQLSTMKPQDRKFLEEAEAQKRLDMSIDSQKGLQGVPRRSGGEPDIDDPSKGGANMDEPSLPTSVLGWKMPTLEQTEKVLEVRRGEEAAAKRDEAAAKRDEAIAMRIEELEARKPTQKMLNDRKEEFKVFEKEVRAAQKRGTLSKKQAQGKLAVGEESIRELERKLKEIK